MAANKHRIDIDEFIIMFKRYFIRKYKEGDALGEKAANKAVRKFVEDVSNTAGNPQLFSSLMRQYEVLLGEFDIVFKNMNKRYSPSFLKDSKEIQEDEYKYSIPDVVRMTKLESRTAIRNRAVNKEVDCIAKKLPAGSTKYYFSEKGVHQLLQLIKPRPGGQKKNK